MKPDAQERSLGKPLVSSETRPAFTLIELLTVIAIIGILAAMVLAAVSRAQNAASKATDINNLNQIITAMHLYTSDDGDVLPPPNWDDGGFNCPNGNGTFAGWLYKPDLTATGTNRFRVNTGLFWETLRDPRIYFCPMDKPYESRYSASQQTDMQRPQQISSYAMNGAVIGYMSMIYPPVKLTQIRPEDCAFWETDERDPFYFNDGANYPGEGVSPRHYQGGIQATFGGQVNYVRLQTWYNDVASPNRNRLWCYPNSADGGDPAAPGHQQE
jgi:prepilin-type N-terminal cleavage/methylation domain-containing protein